MDKETISEIKNSVNIVDVIGETVALTKAGRNFLGLCPFHGEKTPSFNVVEDKQFYHCFGCGKSGDVFKFIEDYRGVSFMEDDCRWHGAAPGDEELVKAITEIDEGGIL